MFILTLFSCWKFPEQVEEIGEDVARMLWSIVYFQWREKSQFSTHIMMHCGLLSDLAEAMGEPGSYEGGGDWLYYIGCVELHLYNIPEEGGPQLL